MNFNKYVVALRPHCDSDYIAIAFGKIGKTMRQFPVKGFYESFTSDAELAGDPDFNPFENLRAGMTGDNIISVLLMHGFIALPKVSEEQRNKDLAAIQLEIDTKLTEFRRDLCDELDISDLPAEFVERLLDDACQMKIFEGSQIRAQELELIHSKAIHLLTISRPLIDALRASTHQ